MFQRKILALLVSSLFLSAAYAAEPIYADKVKYFGSGSQCGTGYRPLTNSEASQIRNFLVGKMGTWQITGLSKPWVIMGSGYGGEIKQQSGAPNDTWCYPSAPGPDTAIPTYSSRVLDTGDDAAVQFTVVNDDNYFIKPASYLAHRLGYAWVGGNHSPYVGDDMDVRKQGDTWVVQGNNDGYCDGYRCDEKTSISVSNFTYILDDGSFSHGEVTQSDRELIKMIEVHAVNNTDVDQQVVVNLKYDKSTNWSKTDTYGYNEKIAVKKSFEWPLVGGFEATVEFGATQSFASTDGGAETESVTVEARPTIPAHSTVPVRVALYRSNISYPYEFKADVNYDVTFDGFLRWSGNAWHTHPTNRPYQRHTFRVGSYVNNQSNIPFQWDHRYSPDGTMWWDWPWAIDQNGMDTMRDNLARFLRPVRASVSGIFSAESQFAGDIEIGNPSRSQPSLKSAELSRSSAPVFLSGEGLDTQDLADLGFGNVGISLTPVTPVR